ncbi:MAG: hypothetical protein ACREFF_03630 [Candidatus Udaeobacter sp.]
MPILATYGELRGWGQQELAKKAFTEARTAIRTGKTTFLAHSSKDDDLVPGTILILENHGAKVYADHKDPSISGSDLLEIADHLRKVIRECGKFVMLATPRSKDSKWIPWELGLGDGIRRHPNIALFPSADTATEMQWSEQEYLGLYKRIVWGRIQGQEKERWLVWDRHLNVAEPLARWLVG